MDITNRHASTASDGHSPSPTIERQQAQDPPSTQRAVAQWLSVSVAKLLVPEPGAPRSSEAPTNKVLSELGIDSLRAIALQYQLQTAFNVLLPIQDLLGGRTIDELADLVTRDEAFRADGTAAAPATATEVLL